MVTPTLSFLCWRRVLSIWYVCFLCGRYQSTTEYWRKGPEGGSCAVAMGLACARQGGFEVWWWEMGGPSGSCCFCSEVWPLRAKESDPGQSFEEGGRNLNSRPSWLPGHCVPSPAPSWSFQNVRWEDFIPPLQILQWLLSSLEWSDRPHSPSLPWELAWPLSYPGSWYLPSAMQCCDHQVHNGLRACTGRFLW